MNNPIRGICAQLFVLLLFLLAPLHAAAKPNIVFVLSDDLAMRDGPWKLLINADGTRAELYDVLADPNETKNLADAQPQIAAKMKRAALQWRNALPKLPSP